MLFTFVFAVASVLTPAVLAAGDFRDFKYTCILHDGVFSAPRTANMSCKGNDGEYRDTNLDLDRCVTNDNAKLTCAPQIDQGGYAGSCTECTMSHTWTGDGAPGTLCCKCPSLDGTQTTKSCIDLNLCIGNDDGKLNC
ncbi:hypothetical protein EXIGLDRAFT_776723 [Exidia glandulosa HHB12029]|uniref:Cyanovirin-N domain-containing protein n=1 Tax=Exidia glandulosa HHB12029 TaxID=1314781 RepID=A0A165DCS5_EXIGL|nr:hypothetical protein EXIGLDRAFT_776723 [Exidia glandulosa HHB12029]